MVNSPSLDTTFSALADPTRRAMLAKLATGEYSIGELAEPFDMSLPAISKHVRVLEDAGLLVRERDGRVHRCNIDPKPINAAVSWLEEMRLFWESRLDALAEYLEHMEEPSWQSKQKLEKASKSEKRSPRPATKSSERGPSRRR